MFVCEQIDGDHHTLTKCLRSRTRIDAVDDALERGAVLRGTSTDFLELKKVDGNPLLNRQYV